MSDPREEEGSTWERTHSRVRRDCDPDRGGLILLLGWVAFFLGVASCWFFGVSAIVALPLGATAWTLGNRDEQRMRAGTMNPAGLGRTRRGRDLGIVAILFSGVAVLVYGTILVFLH